MKKKILIWLSGFMAVVVAVFPISSDAGENPDDFWKFYEQYPHMQEFFPYGMYGGMEGMPWNLGRTRDSAFLRLYLDDFLENNLNITFGGGPNTAYFLKHLSNTNLGKETYYLKYQQWGDWYYRELLPLYEIKALPTVIEWMYHFGNKVFDKYRRPAPLLNEAETAEIEAACKPGLDAAEYLVKNYSNAVVGIVTDDEPGDWASVIAGIELVKKRTGYPAVLCNNNIKGAIYTAKHLRLVTGDLYPAPDHWQIADDLRRFNRECPDGVFWFLPWELADRPNPLTYKPGGVHESSGRVPRAGLRLQIWEALALGCKGYFFFHGGYGFSWWCSGGDTYHAPGFSNFDALLRPHSDLLEEVRLIGKDLTTIGPLLLSCRMEQNVKIGVECGKVSFPNFRGPALDYGLLKDIKHDRYYLIPWNNDIGREQSGTLAIPDDILKGRKIYDIQELREVDADKGRLNVTLIPGGGKIYLIAPAKEYKSCLQTIQRHKTRPERVKVQARYALAKTNQVDLSGADAIITKALKAEAKEKWISAAELYRSAYDAILSAEAGVPELGQIRAKLDAAAADLGTTADTLQVNRRQLDFPMNLGGHEAVSGLYTNKYAGKEIQQWVELWKKYFEAQDKFIVGKNRAALLKDATTLADNTRSNAAAVSKITEARIGELRKPFKVAFITPDYHAPDGDTMEYMQIFSDLTRDRSNYNADWFAPDGKGELVSARCQAFNPADYKVIWIHSLRYSQPPPRGRQARPEQALMPELMKPETIKMIKDHIEKGGGLLLTGIAGIYAFPLGVETNLPDRLRESKLYSHSRFCLGLKPQPGYARHPLFNGFDTNGFFCNGNAYAGNFVPECAWAERLPSGMIVAGELDVQGSEDRYAAAVEYKLGKGKLLVLGGKSIDYTPSDGKNRFGETKSINVGDVSECVFMDRQWQLTVNALGYLAGEQAYVPEAVTAPEKSGRQEDKKAPLPEIQVPKIPDANGDISRVDWTKVADLGGWCSIDGAVTARKIETRVAHDGKYLYVRLIDNLNGTKLTESDEVWGGDVWEIFFSTSRHEPPYRQMAVNVKGKNAALKYGEDEKEWDSGAKIVSTSNADQWRVGLVFPLEKLLPDGLKTGDVFYANFYRQVIATGELLAWSPNYVKAFHELKRMGRFTL